MVGISIVFQHCLAAVALAGFGIELGARELRAGVDDAVAFVFSLVVVVVVVIAVVFSSSFVLRSSFFVFLASSWRPLVVQYSLLLVRVWFKGQNGMQERAFLLSCVLCSGF